MFAPRWGGVARGLCTDLRDARQFTIFVHSRYCQIGNASLVQPFEHCDFQRRRVHAMPVIDEGDDEDDVIELGISTEKVRFIIVKARQYDAKEGDADPDEGSNAADDDMADVLEDKPEDDAVRRELVAFINGLNEEEQINLVALAWVGRGTYDIEEWDEAIDTARTEHNKRTAQYLLGLPLLGDYLAEGLEAFDEDFDDEEDEEFEDEDEELEVDDD
jgi:Protein of unknown function (DUF3775)